MMKLSLVFLIQDTLTTAYQGKWQAGETNDAIMKVALESDLLSIVFIVILIIWAVLFLFMYRLDKKITHLEKNENTK